MFCTRCGKENSNDAVFCAYCGSKLNTPEEVNQNPTFGQVSNPQQPQERHESKGAIGVIMALFLGLIGLIIGLLIYPTGSFERETFLKAWIKTFIVMVVVEIVLIAGFFGCVMCLELAYPTY